MLRYLTNHHDMRVASLSSTTTFPCKQPSCCVFARPQHPPAPLTRPPCPRRTRPTHSPPSISHRCVGDFPLPFQCSITPCQPQLIPPLRLRAHPSSTHPPHGLPTPTTIPTSSPQPLAPVPRQHPSATRKPKQFLPPVLLAPPRSSNIKHLHHHSHNRHHPMTPRRAELRASRAVRLHMSSTSPTTSSLTRSAR